ncbi:hypothetical protein GE09DRAFT_988234, partial [Coniochaeta sp. 2T2.1]
MASQLSSHVDRDATRTLTTAMGPFMDPEHPSCLRCKKSAPAWNRYVKGASALFAYHISRGKRVVVLSPPPPDRFHPCGGTNYQEIEEPILKRGGALEIEMVHPSVNGAESFRYQIWPDDMTCLWVKRFGMSPCQKYFWRAVKSVVTLRFNENREACLPGSTRDISPVEATAHGPVAGFRVREPETGLALKREVQQTELSQTAAKKDAKMAARTVLKKAVETTVEKTAAKKLLKAGKAVKAVK